MASISQKIYRKLPYFAKCWAASLNAMKLDCQRHGEEYQKVIETLKNRENWSLQQFKEFQIQQMQVIIQHAAKNVPHYRNLFLDSGIDPQSIKSLEDLQYLPVLEKKSLRNNPLDFLDETVDKTKLVAAHTSGTTGTPLQLYRDCAVNSADYAFSDYRWRRSAGMQRRRNKSVSIGVYLVADPRRKRPPFWVYNKRWKQLYLSCYHLSPEYLACYYKKLREFRAEYIEGYPSSIYSIAKYILDNQLERISFRACFTTAETLMDYQRATIEKAFGCKVYDQYGSNEFIVFAAQCNTGSMHISPEVGIIEVLDKDDKPVPVGTAGRLVCTGLLNKTQPLIRYRIGDLGALSSQMCICGSQLPILKCVEGRMDDVLITKDGRQIGRLDSVFKDVNGVHESQIVQDDLDVFRIRVVPTDDYSGSDGQKLIENLSQRIGQADIKIELVGQIERTKAGKFRAVIRNIPADHD